MSSGWLGPDRFVAAGTVAMALAMALFGFSRAAPLAFAAAFIAGAGWTTRAGEPQPLGADRAARLGARARPGDVPHGGVRLDHRRQLRLGLCGGAAGPAGDAYLAAAGAIAGIPLSWSWRLQTAEGMDLSPSMHWQAPILSREVEDDSGPVLVTLRYRLAGDDPEPFLDAIEEVGRQRRRDGAYAWGIFADVAQRNVYLETFLIGSWLEARYLRQRVTKADREREDEVRALLAEPPTVTLMLHADAPKTGIEAQPDINLLFHHFRNDRLTLARNASRAAASARSMP